MNNKILVLGGLGYIGSHMVKLLHKNGYEVTIIDNLSNGRKENPFSSEIKFANLDISDVGSIREVLKEEFLAVFHFAAFIEAGESMSKPEKYYKNNVANTIEFLNQIIGSKIKYLIFSSTAAIYGEPVKLPICEKHKKDPVNIYGHSKLIIEEILQNYERIYGLNCGILRYFNACGSDYKNNLGECHNPETHLIPLLLQYVNGRRKEFYVYGDDYNTKDGTCIRDYIHVHDICQAHLDLLNYMIKGGKERHFNIGSGTGYSILEIIDEVKKCTKKDFSIIYKKRRDGDPSILVADNSLAKQKLKWRPIYNLSDIIKSAWEWEKILSNKINKL